MDEYLHEEDHIIHQKLDIVVYAKNGDKIEFEELLYKGASTGFVKCNQDDCKKKIGLNLKPSSIYFKASSNKACKDRLTIFFCLICHGI